MNLRKVMIAAGAILTIGAATAFFALTGCTKDTNLENNKKAAAERATTSSTISLPLCREEIDKLAIEIGIAHNSIVFAMYGNPDIDAMNATELCHYVHGYLVENSDKMGLTMLTEYMNTIDTLAELDGVYSIIGDLIHDKGSEMLFIDGVNQELISNSMKEYYDFINTTLLESDTYDEFEEACMKHLDELCAATTTIEDYFYMRVGGCVTFASYCAWVTIFSGVDYNNTKGLFNSVANGIRQGFKAVKEFVADNIVRPIQDIVRADLAGGCIGGLGGLTGIGVGAAIAGGVTGGVAVGVFVGCWAVGAAAGSLFF